MNYDYGKWKVIVGFCFGQINGITNVCLAYFHKNDELLSAVPQESAVPVM